MTTLISLSERLGNSIFTLTWQTGLLILVVAIATLCLKKARPAVRYALWLVVLIRLCVPVGISTPLGIPPKVVQQATPINVTPPPEQPQWNADSRLVNEEMPASTGQPKREIRVNPAPHLQKPALPTPKASLPPLSMKGWIGLGWMIVAFVLAASMSLRMWLVRRIIRKSEPVTNPKLNDLLDGLRERLGIRRAIALRMLPATAKTLGPCATGIIRPVIFIPARMVEHWDANALEPILLHELAHIRRGDLIVHALQVLVQIVYWFHPLVWFSNARLRHERELICDDMAVAHSGGNSKRYGATVLRAVEEFQRSSSPIAGLGIGESKLATRLKRLLGKSYTVPRPLGIMALIAVLFGGVLGVMIASEGKPLKNQGNTADSAASKKPEAKESTPKPTPTADAGFSEDEIRKIQDGAALLELPQEIATYYQDYNRLTPLQLGYPLEEQPMSLVSAPSRVQLANDLRTSLSKSRLQEKPRAGHTLVLIRVKSFVQSDQRIVVKCEIYEPAPRGKYPEFPSIDFKGHQLLRFENHHWEKSEGRWLYNASLTVPHNGISSEESMVSVKVVDEAGKPVEGAKVEPYMINGQGDGSSWKASAVTDSTGTAEIAYPNTFNSGKTTESLSLSVDHPDFCRIRLKYSVKGDAIPCIMPATAPVEISAYLEGSNEPVSNLILEINRSPAEEIGGLKMGQQSVTPQVSEWVEIKPGTLSQKKLPEGNYSARLAKSLSDGVTLYSDVFSVEAKRNKLLQLKVPMKPGARLEGKLDDAVPRPVKYGRVLVYVLPDKPVWDHMIWSHDTRVSEDGTFVFPTLPAGEVVLEAECEGYLSAEIRQSLRLKFGETATTIVPMENPVTAKITVLNSQGEPLPGADVWVNRANGLERRAVMLLGPWNSKQTTDAAGMVQVEKLRASLPIKIVVTHPELAPFTPGQPNKNIFPVEMGKDPVSKFEVKLNPTDTLIVPKPKPTADAGASAEKPKTFLKVVDQSGNPIAGATVLRWYPKATSTSNSEGLADATPLIENLGDANPKQIGLIVDAPGYCMEQVHVELGNPWDPVVLKKGGVLEVSGYLDDPTKILKNVFVQIATTGRIQEPEPLTWTEPQPGVKRNDRVPLEAVWIRAVHIKDDGDLLFSKVTRVDMRSVVPPKLNLPLYPGVKLQGRFDETVSRPVQGGWVCMLVFPEESNRPNHGGLGRLNWRAEIQVNPDGTFSTPSLPPGEISVVAGSKGFVYQGAMHQGNRLGLVVNPDQNRLVIPMERASSMEVKVVDLKGQPVAGADVNSDSRVYWNKFTHGAAGLLGFNTSVYLSTGKGTTLPPDRKIDCSAKTNAEGVALVGCFQRDKTSGWVKHPDFAMSEFETRISPDQVASVTVQMAPKGVITAREVVNYLKENELVNETKDSLWNLLTK